MILGDPGMDSNSKGFATFGRLAIEAADNGVMTPGTYKEVSKELTPPKPQRSRFPRVSYVANRVSARCRRPAGKLLVCAFGQSKLVELPIDSGRIRFECRNKCLRVSLDGGEFVACVLERPTQLHSDVARHWATA